MPDPVLLHTERGDIELSSAEMRLYLMLADDRWKVHTVESLCRAIGCTSRELGEHARSFRDKCSTLGLTYCECIWGVGYRLETPYWETNAA